MSTDTSVAPTRPGVPDHATIVGDWDAGRPPPPDLRARMRKVYFHALERRTFWAHHGGEVAVARAVAYQSIAGMIQRALEASADAPPPGVHDEPTDVGTTPAASHPLTNEEWLADTLHQSHRAGSLAQAPALLASEWLAAHDRALLADVERRLLRGSWSDLAVICIQTAFREARPALKASQ